MTDDIHLKKDSVILAVSEDTRRIARMPIDKQIGILDRERNEILYEVRAVEDELSKYSTALFIAEQSRIRQKYIKNPKKSISKWLARKSEMGIRRTELLTQKRALHDRLSEMNILLKPLKQKKHEIHDLPIDVLNDIKDLLVDLISIIKK